ncbi:MAG: response regulator transcription factor [Gammaproteobacteria bacterium]|jgi:two-component system response regulator CpxR|nr:response regulator transcription factor [Gammaproteobacteria bacterium]
MTQAPPRLLLIDDDISLAKMLHEFLELHGFQVTVVHEGETGLRCVNEDPPDLVILDVMLPDISGFDVLKRLRADHDLPVVMLTARGDESDRIFGLMGGADDYLPKPFNPLELTVRIQAILKRSKLDTSGQPARDTLNVGPLTMDLKRCTMSVNDTPVPLTAAEMRVLEQLMRRPGEVLSRAGLTKLALDRPIEAYDRSIDTLISKIRGKLATAGIKAQCIRGLRGHGYVLDDEFSAQD